MLKTLLAEVDGRLVCGVVPVSGSLDLKALAAAVGGKRGVMADPAVAERSTGYVVGGISPLGQRTPLPTVVDESAELFDTVVVSAGRRGLSIELAPADLVRLTGAVVAGVARSSGPAR
jgi:Cys-tRNA(Pro)/Cys-tRNA(Cys) deacylase